MESTEAASILTGHFFFITESSNPTTPALAFTPQKNAVAEPAESAICWSVLYVYKSR